LPEGKKERLELDAGDRITEGIVTRRAKTPKAAWSRGLFGRVIEPDPTEGRGTPILPSILDPSGEVWREQQERAARAFRTRPQADIARPDDANPPTSSHTAENNTQWRL
jgi:hypothetical protein